MLYFHSYKTNAEFMYRFIIWKHKISFSSGSQTVWQHDEVGWYPFMPYGTYLINVNNHNLSKRSPSLGALVGQYLKMNHIGAKHIREHSKKPVRNQDSTEQWKVERGTWGR